MNPSSGVGLRNAVSRTRDNEYDTGFYMVYPLNFLPNIWATLFIVDELPCTSHWSCTSKMKHFRAMKTILPPIALSLLSVVSK